MEARIAREGEISRVVEIVDGAIRRPGGTTSAADDFPLALCEANHAGIYVVDHEGDIAACLVTLTRELRTSLGPVPTAMIGSVVTRPDFRGRGLSRTLQERAMADLRKKAALAVLWTEEPAYYEKRGFAPAGVEYHAALGRWRPGNGPVGDRAVRLARAEDYNVLESCFRHHPFATERARRDSVRLYGMPGTDGFILEKAGAIVAYAFVGKGADFFGWAHEWGGDPEAVLTLVGALQSRGIVSSLLVPQGHEELAGRLRAEGAAVEAAPIGLWTVLDEERLREIADSDEGLPPAAAPASAWLGLVTPGGEVREGICKVAIWGFDSV